MSTIVLGGDLPLHRLGFGAMHLTGPDVWGPPADPAAAHAVARRAVELGVNFIDTADSYGPGSNEEVLADALFPYPEGLVIGTKVGQSRPSRHEWRPLGRPEYIRQQAELSLRRLRLDRIDLFQLHRIDPKVPAEEQFEALKQLQEEGKIRHIGLSEVTVAQLEQARRQIEVVSVQNLYNLSQRKHDEVVDYCERENLVFIPWVPIASGDLTRSDGALGRIAKQLDATPAQVALAWLLHRSPVILPIPGTSSIAHLEENVAAGSLELTTEQVAELTAETG
ncbi:MULTISPECIES: aldo/keto reductase [Micromonospora]|uniref:Predicted oxidoreductase n=1 Tax=Micromonospora yangpuensis TaxID=683228 RepID=A0A1C6V3V2_9ACTN|nr:aldo/keto reductase [Micromonospora yangpuensis]GGM15174.1 oxidoreductase [Micromonospora yangpuensis]SCL60915.1 Predicted oxidoreductase [Micromonospora yangpuensis]